MRTSLRFRKAVLQKGETVFLRFQKGPRSLRRRRQEQQQEHPRHLRAEQNHTQLLLSRRAVLNFSDSVRDKVEGKGRPGTVEYQLYFDQFHIVP